MSEQILNKLASILHEMWMDEKIFEGYHFPARCPNYEDNHDEESGVIVDPDLIHCKKCNPKLTDFEHLTHAQQKTYLNKAKVYLDKLKKHGLNISNL